MPEPTRACSEWVNSPGPEPEPEPEPEDDEEVAWPPAAADGRPPNFFPANFFFRKGSFFWTAAIWAGCSSATSTLATKSWDCGL
jgi:hypothetical protein